jgi:hypothetical protein
MRFLKRRPQGAAPVEPKDVAAPSEAPVPARPWADPNWLAWQTLSYSGSAQIKTAGVTHHREDLRSLANRYGRLVMAELRIEEEGQYAGAVRVYVDGRQLGSIPHGLASEFREVIHRLSVADQPATCRAQLDPGPGYIDVWLCAKSRERAADDPFLPPMLGARLNLSADTVRYLDEVILGQRAKSKRVVRTAELVECDGGWTVVLDGRELGALPDGQYPRLEEVSGTEFPLTCQVRILRQPDRPLRVEADFPTIEF